MSGYGAMIENWVDQIPYNKPFSGDEIAKKMCDCCDLPIQQSKAIINNKLKRMADSGKIERIQRGMYYRIQQTVFGPAKQNVDKIFTQALTRQGDEVIGYETGAAFLNRIGLSTLLPRQVEVATNRFRRKPPTGSHILVRRPATTITTNNYGYLQLLDAVDELPRSHVDTPEACDLIRSFADRQGIDPLQMIYTARRHYSAKTAMRTIDIFMGVEK